MTGTPSNDSNLRRRFDQARAITGASDGIGGAFAVQLAEHGLELVAIAPRGQVLPDMALDLGSRFGKDVRVPAKNLSDAVPDPISLGEGAPVGLSLVVARLGSIGPFLEQSWASEIKMVDLGCWSVIGLPYGFVQRMAAAKRSGIELLIPGDA